MEFSTAHPDYIIFNSSSTGAKYVYVRGVCFCQADDPGEHTLTIFAPDTIIGTSGKVYTIYDDTVVEATYSTSNPGVTISGTTLSFSSSGSVTVTASYRGLTATKTITLEYKAGTSTDITTNPDGSTTTTTTTENPDGSTEVHATTENTDGTTTTQSTTTNTDGSSSSTTTNYDLNGDPTDKTTTDNDTSGNTITSNAVYDENGNEVRSGYSIDTTDNPGGSYEPGTSGVDSGVIAFDPDHPGFTIHAVLEFNPKSYGDNNNFIEAYDKTTKRGLYLYTSSNFLYKKVQTGNYTTNSSYKSWRELTGGNANYYQENHITTFDIVYTTDKKLSMYVTGEGQTQRVVHFENFDVGTGDTAMAGLTVEVGKGGKTGIIIHELTVIRTGL